MHFLVDNYNAPCYYLNIKNNNKGGKPMKKTIDLNDPIIPDTDLREAIHAASSEIKSIKSNIIDRILSEHEPDQVIIDILNEDLLPIAEKLLRELDTNTLLNILENGEV